MKIQLLFERARRFLAAHPAARDALLWCIPALLLGAVVRILFTIDLPYAFWGADSRSYFSFAHRLITDQVISLDEKRRFLYPIFLTPVALLPGPPLRWLAVIQHAIGVVTLLPLAYIVRKVFRQWRLWIVPVTALYAVLPVIVWYEHELLGENVFFATFLWAFAGWVAWVSEPRQARQATWFWWFFVPFAAFILTKPSGRFAWPGVALGLVFVGAWRWLGWKQFTALAVLVVVTLTVGSKKQGAWLLYTATFPLTQLDSPLHADYKAQIRDLVEPLQNHLGAYYLLDGVPFQFLENTSLESNRPLWQALYSNLPKRTSVYIDLALEGIKARPAMFLSFGVQRLIGSANLSEFRRDRFSGAYFRNRTEHFYAEGQREEANRVRMAYALPAHGSLPPYEEFRDRLDPTPGSWRLRAVQSCMNAVGESLDFVRLPTGGERADRTIARARPTLLGCWLVLGAVLAICLPTYRRTLGVWTVLIGGYLFGVFLVSQQNPRYFGPAWIVVVPLLAVPADVIVTLLKSLFHRGYGNRATESEKPTSSPAPTST